MLGRRGGRRTHVESRLDEEGLLSLIGLLSLSDLGGASLEADLLLGLGLTLVLVEETEELDGGVLVEDLGELGNCRGDLEALVKDNLLPLEPDVFGPLDETGEVGRGLDGLSWRGEESQRESRIIGRLDEPIPKFLGFFSKRGLALVALGFVPE
jgi:hypothetical protein